MSITKKEALAIVEAVEASAPWGDEDHIERSIASAMNKLADELSKALGVPDCVCRYGHDEYSKICPRIGFGEVEQ